PRRGDFCRAPIPFTDGTGEKIRPVLVLAPQGLNLLVVPLTTHPPRDQFDVPLLPSASGLRKQGTARCSQLLLISQTVVIELLGLKHGTLYNPLARGKIRWAKLRVNGQVSGVRVWDLASVRQFILSQMEPTQEEMRRNDAL